MQIDHNQHYAVLTGDFIKSSRYTIEQRQAAFQTLRESTAQLIRIHPEIQTIGIEPFRGDAWQLLHSQPQYAFHASFFFRAALNMHKLPDTRIAIGMGSVDDVPNQSLAEASGEAFHLSGNGLDTLKKNRHMVFDFAASGLSVLEKDFPPGIGDIINSALYLASRMADGWSSNEARAVWGAMQGQTQEDIGKLWPEPIKQQSVRDALYRAGWDEIENCLKVFVEYFSSLQAK
jgi:hypothetical protein